MSIHEEGYIKFRCHWSETIINIPPVLLEQISNARAKLINDNLIGAYDNGIGFGNISMRDTDDPGRFYITGSATGRISKSDSSIYSLVERWDVKCNTLWCSGPVKASSESMSHAVIYEANPGVNCVAHIHNMELWKYAIKVLPCTPQNAAYGTPEMAHAIIDLILEHNLRSQGIFAMKGHEEGIIAFGEKPEGAMGLLYKFS